MNLKEINQKLADTKAAMLALHNSAKGRKMTAEEDAKYAALKAEKVELEALHAQETERLALEAETAGRGFDARRSAGQIEVKDLSEDKPYATHREFLADMMQETVSQRINPRLNGFRSNPDPYRATQGSDEQGVYSDPHGGYLVPSTVMAGLLTVSAEQDPLANLVTPVPMATEKVQLNARVDKSHSTSVSGGLTVSRRAETVDGASSRMQFEKVELNAHELFGVAHASERILEASPMSFMAILNAGFGDEFAANAINERLNGSGTGEFQGAIEAGCTISVSKETGQAAATIVKENIDKMAARCWRYGQSVYLANHNTRPQLRSLVQIVGTGGNAVPYFTQNNSGQEFLDGRPIFFTEFAKTLGTKGDLILGNWSQYLQGTYHGMRQAESIHVRFLANERTFKFWLMNDGAPWWRSALTPKNGDTLSPFVVLATRA